MNKLIQAKVDMHKKMNNLIKTILKYKIVRLSMIANKIRMIIIENHNR
jgi:hypothetical protein